MNPLQTHGAVSWHEYLASDVSSALKFYTELLGWTTTDLPVAENEVYTLLYSKSKRVGGLRASLPDIPVSWIYYVTVHGIRKLLEENELNLIVPLEESEGWPSAAGFLDPEGAYLSVIQYHDGNEQDDASITDIQDAFLTHGAFSWMELQAADPKTAADWYGKLFDWAITEEHMPTGSYYVISVEGIKIGGIMKCVDPNIPPHWNCYVTVDDVDAVQAKAAELGATITAPAFDLPEVGRLLHICDPTGASLAFATWLPNHK